MSRFKSNNPFDSNIGRICIIAVILVMNILFHTTGGFSYAWQTVHPVFAIFMQILLLYAFGGYIYLAIKRQ